MRKTEQKNHGTKKSQTQTKKTNILDKESSMKTLYEILDVSKKYDFVNVPIAVLQCPIMVGKKLQKYNIKSLSDLFSKTIYVLCKIYGIRTTSIIDLLSVCKQFLQTNGYTEPYRYGKNVSIKKTVEITKKYTNSIVNNEYFDLATVDTEYLFSIQIIDNIYSDLGEELFKCIYTYSNANNYTVSVLNQIAESSKFYSLLNLIEQKTTVFLKKYQSGNKISIKSFEGLWRLTFREDLPEIFTTKDILTDIPRILIGNDEISINQKNSYAEHIIAFLEFLSSDIKNQMQKIREDINNCDKHKNKEKIVELRDEGNTFDTIGIILAISSGTVRRNYYNAIVDFSKKMSKIFIEGYITLIHILSGRKKLLIRSDISLFTDKMIAIWIWNCLQNQRLCSDEYYYSKKYDAVIFLKEEGELPDEIDLYTLFDIDSDCDFLTDNYSEEQKKLFINISSDILERFVLQNSPVYKSTIFQNYPEYGKYTLPEAMKHCHNVISTENGYYLHTSTLSLCEKDRLFLKQYLEETTIKSPLNINTVYTHCQHYMIDFMEQNNITESYKLFAILKYMFNENFDFNWPFIAKKDSGRVITRDLIISILEPYEKINISQLSDIIKVKGYDPISFRNILHLVYPDYIRVNKNTLMKTDLTGLNESIIKKTLSSIYEIVEEKGYILPKNIHEYNLFPKINIHWSQYLFKEMVLNNNVVRYFHLDNFQDDKFDDSIVFISKKYETYDYQSFLLKIILDVYGQEDFFDPKNKYTFYDVSELEIFVRPIRFLTNDNV